ncbi:hypothetical protein DYB32_008017 [Aphanomyces invadans]|uniref:Apple domain-containing protein n=1 Tax=Aphanomyces invadans TaxID=157072 RepID=A0A418AM46_9STRA|nr:hypothetical protein DYB32_008017 [Aphanomyces invadans]
MKVAIVLSLLAAAAQATIGSSQVLRSLEDTSSVNESFAEPTLLESSDEPEDSIAASSTATEAPSGPTEAAIDPSGPTEATMDSPGLAEAAYPWHKPRVCKNVVDDVTYKGHDIEKTYRHNHKDCCDDCLKTHGCVAYVWTRTNHVGTCHLKSKVGKPCYLHGAKAAEVKKKPVGKCVKKFNTDFFGNDIGELRGDAKDCCRYCMVTKRCVGYSHFHGVCYLKSEVPKYGEYKKGVTSGYLIR